MGEDDAVVEPYISAYKFPYSATAAALSPEHLSGMATPPLHALASVPFKWEEQPGKPRPCTDIIVRPEPARGLEPPPCRSGAKITRMPSPTTVLDGPYNLSRPRFSSFRMFREKQSSFDSSSSGGGGGGGSPQSQSYGDVSVGKKNGRLKMSRLFNRSLRVRKEADEGSLGFSPSSFAGFDSDFVEGKMKMKMRRNGRSFSSFSQTAPSPPLWVSLVTFYFFINACFITLCS